MLYISFIYTSGWQAAAAAVGGVVNFTVSIGADADFRCNYITCSVRQAGLLVANWGGDIIVNDSGKGRTLMNQALALDAIAGTGQLPYHFKPARIFPANSSVVITIINNVVTATDVQVAFHGNKEYPSESPEFEGDVQL